MAEDELLASLPPVDLEDEGTWDCKERVDALRALSKRDGDSLDVIFTEDTECLKRFLRARRGDVPKALEMLLAHQTFRLTDTPWWPVQNAPLDSMSEDIHGGKAWVDVGRDKLGHPVSFIRVKLHDASQDAAKSHRFVTFLMDETLARLDRPPHNASQFSMVIDFEDFGRANFDTDIALFILKGLQTNFPERLYRLYFVRETWLFWALWKILSVFIDARSAAKIQFLGGSYLPALLEDMDAETIPTWLGGKNEYAYQPWHVLEPSKEGNPNPYISVRDGPRAHLGPVPEGSRFPKKPEDIKLTDMKGEVHRGGS
jgi:hypothetical protein